MVGTGEDAVVIQVQIGKRTVSALINTGAKPCVMDRKTLINLQLGAMMVDAANQVYGLCNVPVKVLGYIDTEIQLGDRPPLVQRIQILDSEDPTIILGRSFMCKFKEVVFDFEHGRIKLGKNWENVDVSASGSTPISRAALASEILSAEEIKSSTDLINPDLTMEECSQLRKLIEEFPNLFADDPKRPSRIKIEDAHCHELERNSPGRTRPKKYHLHGRKR